MSPASYREVLPAPPLRRYIECYWFLRARRAAAPEPQPILPDGCMELVLNLGDPFRRCHEDSRNAWSEEQPSRMLVGQMDHHVTVRATGTVDVVGVRFHPSGAHPLLRFPMAELANELVPLEDVVCLPARLGSDSSTEERKRALDAILSERFGNAAAPDPDFERAVSSIVRAEGRISVDDLAAGMGVGPRQLERRFRERVGLGPKRFAKVLRFQSVFRSGFLDERSWAELALDCGYYDQSHFIRDFKSFTGRSPSILFSNENVVTRVFTRRRRRSGSYNMSS
jgi:AraC-like DNA-binding protein